MDGLKAIGIEAHPPAPESIPSRREVPIERRNLCLAYPSPGDLLINGKKFGGSAQRRLGKVWHQQGFFLLRPITPPDYFKDPSTARLMAEHSTSLQACGHDIEVDRLRIALTNALLTRRRESES
jgi:lipoate-protein ligase A